MKGSEYLAIVIAAGLSSRMGGFKPLLDIGEKPALIRLLDTILETGIGNIIVITGHEREKIEAAVMETLVSVSTIYNDNYDKGMFGSVKAGIKEALVNEAICENGAALLFPADVPLVSAETIFGLIEAFETRTKGDGSSVPRRRPFAVPVYEGKNGHPLLIPREYFGEILAYEGEGGLKGVRSRYDADMIRYETDDAGCILDMDTREDYAALLEYDKRRK